MDTPMEKNINIRFQGHFLDTCKPFIFIFDLLLKKNQTNPIKKFVIGFFVKLFPSIFFFTSLKKRATLKKEKIPQN